MLEGAKLDGFMELFNIESKRDLKKYCRTFVVREVDLAALILTAEVGSLEPYRYCCHFDQTVASHLLATEDELAALSQNGIGPLKDQAKKAVRKAFQLIDERRCFSAHLFYTPCQSYWFLFYFEKRDESVDENHWGHGAHIHLVSSHWPNLQLERVWRQVKEGKLNFSNKIHLRYSNQNEPDA